MTPDPQDATGQYELKEYQLWEERPQEGFMPFQYDGVIPSNPRVASSGAIQNPIIVSIINEEPRRIRQEIAGDRTEIRKLNQSHNEPKR